MKKIKINNVSELKVGDTIEILKRPESWSAYFNNNRGLDMVKYPYQLTIRSIKEVSIHSYSTHTAINCGNYGWSLDSIIKAGCNKILVEKELLIKML